METLTEKKYVCEYCRFVYPKRKAALACQARCKQRSLQRQQWFKANPPKFKVGDFVYALSGGYTIQVESIAKHSQFTNWVYHGTDYNGTAGWISSQHAQLLLSRQEADARRIALNNMIQGSTIEDISFAAIVKNCEADEVETHITLKDKYIWKQ